jgi:hypothetical protein
LTSFLISFSGVSQQVELKNTKMYSSFLKPMSKMLQKNEKISMSYVVFPIIFSCVFGRFSTWGVQEHQNYWSKKSPKPHEKKYPPTYVGGFFLGGFSAPWLQRKGRREKKKKARV